MVTDGLLILLQGTSLDGLTPLGVVAMALMMLGKYGTEAVRSLRNGRHAPSDSLQKAATRTKEIYDILTFKTPDGRPLVYHEQGVKDAVIELGATVESMKSEIVTEIRNLRTAVQKNGSGAKRSTME